jgi:hypothetical protein
MINTDFMVASLFFLGLGLLFLFGAFSSLKQVFEQLNIRKWPSASAEVLDATYLQGPPRHRFSLELRFTDMNGGLVEAKCRTDRAANLGDTVKDYYNVNNPNRLIVDKAIGASTVTSGRFLFPAWG